MADEIDGSWGEEEEVPEPEDKPIHDAHEDAQKDAQMASDGAEEMEMPPARHAVDAVASEPGTRPGSGSSEASQVRDEPAVPAVPATPQPETTTASSGADSSVVTEGSNPTASHPSGHSAGSGGGPHKEAESSHSSSGGSDLPGLDLLYDVELDATLQFGSKEMLLRDVLELGPGDVVELDRHIAEPVDLVVGDRIVARGEVVVASGNFALRVTEVATPQMRLESIRCLF